MDKKKTFHTMLAYPEENHASKECCLNVLPVIHVNTEQLASGWHNTFKYFQGESRFCNIRKKGNVSRMAEILISHGGKQNAC